MAVTYKVLGVVAVIGGANLVKIERTNVWKDFNGVEQTYTYDYEQFEGEGLEQLNNIRIALEYLSKVEEDSSEDEALQIATGATAEELIERFEEEAADVAEELEIAFIYDGSNGKREYTPAAFWEASGGCEWEESAQYGYHYGWNI